MTVFFEITDNGILNIQPNQAMKKPQRRINIRGSHVRDPSGIINFYPESACTFEKCLPEARKLFRLYARVSAITVWFNDRAYTMLRNETKRMTLIRFHILRCITPTGTGYLINGVKVTGEVAMQLLSAMTKQEFGEAWRQHEQAECEAVH